MPNHRYLAFFIVSILLSSVSGFGQITVTITNIKKVGGTILIALYDSKKTFNKASAVYREGRAKVAGKNAEFVFDTIPDGDYAISLFHDANDNNKLDMSDLGFPKEQYGFSNNALGSFGPPPYKKARFKYHGQPLKVDIQFK